MHDYKKNFENAVRFGIAKIKIEWWRVLLMGILGGIYIGIAYYGLVKVLGIFATDTSPTTVGFDGLTIRAEGFVAAASVFPVGLIFIVFLGASVFNGDNLSIMAFLFRKIKLRDLFKRWGLVLLANFIGALVIGWVFSLSNAWSSKDIKVIAYLINRKLFVDEAWNIFFSAIVSNIVIVGTLWASFASPNAIGKLVVIWLPIFLLAIAGFNHIPVNFALYGIGLVRHNDIAVHLAAAHATSEILVARANAWGAVNIYWVLLPTLAGNFFSGVLFMPIVYYFIVKFRSKPVDPNAKPEEISYNENFFAVCNDELCYIRDYKKEAIQQGGVKGLIKGIFTGKMFKRQSKFDPNKR